MINPFFKNRGPIKINEILNSANITNKFDYTDTKIFDVKDLILHQIMILLFFIQKIMKMQLQLLKQLIV